MSEGRIIIFSCIMAISPRFGRKDPHGEFFDPYYAPY